MKMDCALNLVAGGRPVKLISESLGVVCSQLTVRLNPAAQIERRRRVLDDTALVNEIRTEVSELPSYGYRRVWDLLRHRREAQSQAPVNVKRDYLNTVAQMGGLSQLDVAKWSGRAKITHNRCYDHQSDRDILALAREALGNPEKSAGHVASLPPSSLITRDQFAELKILTAHTTDLGYCAHDFSMLPCQLHRDCSNCDEHFCIKGDHVRECAIRQHH